ncbi:hypothetical protein C370_07359 [Cryptococcus neoformans A1-35-8]|nr:hypothetical protein C369_07410 [Cryptococcus neoformans var. grubii A5-35-17]OXH00114.1 hypothetical protein C370_07359 [Cryptococcus neoformans var. grubii A1-35-8]
MKLIYTYIPSN